MPQHRVEVIDRTYAAILAAKTQAERHGDHGFDASHGTASRGVPRAQTFPRASPAELQARVSPEALRAMEQSQILRYAADTLDALAVPSMVVGSCAEYRLWRNPLHAGYRHRRGI